MGLLHTRKYKCKKEHSTTLEDIIITLPVICSTRQTLSAVLPYVLLKRNSLILHTYICSRLYL